MDCLRERIFCFKMDEPLYYFDQLPSAPQSFSANSGQQRCHGGVDANRAAKGLVVKVLPSNLCSPASPCRLSNC